MAGLGNYLRCEILFAAGLHPAVRAADCGPEEIQRLSRTLLRLPRQSYRLGGITNDPVRARNLMAEGYTFEDARFLVFRRSDKPCYRCGSTVARTFSNGRPFYLCHACQPSRMK